MAVMFEAFAQKPQIKRARWMSVSVVVHAVLLVLAWRAMLVVHAPAETKDSPRVTFFAAPPPPPPPAGGSKPKPRVIKKKELPRQIIQPDIVQPAEPQPADKAEAETEDEGQAGGVVGGVAGGIVGGVVGGVIGEFDGRMTPPKLISGPTIQYTEKALEHDVEGLMIVRCVMTLSGEVKGCQVRQSVRFMDSTVVETLEKRRYTPVTLEGRPIEVYYTFRIRLNLPK